MVFLVKELRKKKLTGNLYEMGENIILKINRMIKIFSYLGCRIRIF